MASGERKGMAFLAAYSAEHLDMLMGGEANNFLAAYSAEHTIATMFIPFGAFLAAYSAEHTKFKRD
ncbi:hypothetical protein GCZ65_16255 [Vibrio cholerae]|nr:hypothetical protein [Vibrio cholerae]